MIADTATIGAAASVVPAMRSRTSSRTRSSQSASTVSALVRTTTPRVDAEQVEDGQVLGGLRHGAFVGGDDEEGGVDAADARRACS